MADVYYWEDTLLAEIDEVRNLLRSASSQDGRELAQMLEQIEKKVRSAQGTKRSYKMELRLMADPESKKMFEDKLLVHEQSVSALADELKTMKEDQNRSELFDGGGVDEEQGVPNGDAMLNQASTIQDKTQDALNNITNMVQESNEVASDALNELIEQKLQIQDIDKVAMEMEDNLKRAEKLIKNFGRSLATDKFIMSCAVLNMFLMLGLVVFIVINKRNEAAAAANPISPTAGT